MNREKILQDLRNVIVNTADIELDEYPDHTIVSNTVTHGDVEVYYKTSHSNTYVEVYNNVHHERDYSNVRDWLEEHLDRYDVLDEVADMITDAEEDEWQAHGFRDAQDYYNYRYH